MKKKMGKTILTQMVSEKYCAQQADIEKAKIKWKERVTLEGYKKLKKKIIVCNLNKKKKIIYKRRMEFRNKAKG
jgi:hypothetical protein